MGCAILAAQLRKEIVKLKEELYEQRRYDTERISSAESYRLALEDELNRNKKLIHRLVSASTSSSQLIKMRSKFIATLRWILQQINEDESINDENKDLIFQSTLANSLKNINVQ